MHTIFDLVTLVIFAGLVVLFLQRSMAAHSGDKIIHYVPPALGCAVANYLGNDGQVWIAWALIVAVVVYSFIVLKPLRQAD